MNQKIKELSQKLDIPENVIKKAYKGYWSFIRQKTSELPLKEDLSEEEFKKLRTNFNILGLGKLYCNYGDWLSSKRKWRYLDDKYKENQTDV